MVSRGGQRTAEFKSLENAHLDLLKETKRRGNGVIKTNTICCGANKAMTSASEQVHINLSF